MTGEELYGNLTPSELEYTKLREQTGWSLDEMAANTGKDSVSVIQIFTK